MDNLKNLKQSDIDEIEEFFSKDLNIVTVAEMREKQLIIDKIKTNIGEDESEKHQELIRIVCKKIISNLEYGYSNIECNTVAAYCLYRLISLLKNNSDILKQFNESLQHFKLKKMSSEPICNQIIVYNSCLIQNFTAIPSALQNDSVVLDILENIYCVAFKMAYEYSKYTYSTFRNLQGLLNKQHEWSFYDDNILLKLLKLTCENFENPIQGVRDVNCKLFYTLLVAFKSKKKYYYINMVIDELNNFPWNKAKFMMLSAIYKLEGDVVKKILNVSNIIKRYRDGLIRSLTSVSLISAAADMYNAITKQVNTEDWIEIFYDKFKTIFLNGDVGIIKNINNYFFNTSPMMQEIYILYLNEFLKSSHLDQSSVYGFLCIYKHFMISSSKYPLSTDNLEKCNLWVAQSLYNANSDIRTIALDIVCISYSIRKSKASELNLIVDYIKCNMNSDCTSLRQNMFNNIRKFLLEIQSNLCKTKEQSKKFEIFLNKYEQVVYDSLIIQGNYQRKITALKLCEIYLCSLAFRKKYIQSSILNTKKTQTVLIKYLEDPAQDIRECTSQILVNYFLETFNNINVLNDLYKTALTKIQSKYFYEINSGHSIMKLVTLIIIKIDNLKLMHIEDIYKWALNEIIEQSKCLDIVGSIESGKILHSFINVIYNILDVCLSKKHHLNNIKDIENLINALECIPFLYCHSFNNKTSADFYEMSEMIENLIGESELKNKYNSEKISDVHQIVLNCIWLNLKACCDLSLIIIKFLTIDRIDEIYRCLLIIKNILETSRHKGVMEGAGMALGRAINYLTTHEEVKLRELAVNLLNEIMDDIKNTDRMCSVTRRGAGLSIMLHKIVGNDMNKEKPLFHHVMQTLIWSAKNECDFPCYSNVSKEIDIPKAIHIHLLTKIVADSSLATETSYYLADIGEVAFGNLTNDQWQIRNAALQLYGSLLPKLIGQKKSLDNEVAATVACDEFKTHAPKLWEYIQKSLQQSSRNDDVLQKHSNLLPIVNLLASLAPRYKFSFISELVDKNEPNNQSNENDISLFNNLMKLLESPIYAVRRLTAKSIKQMFDFEMVAEFILNSECCNENQIHGFLLLIKLYRQNYFQNYYYGHLKQHFDKLFSFKPRCYILKAAYDECFWELLDSFDYICILKESEHFSKIGLPLWANYRIELFLVNSNNFAQVVNFLKNIDGSSEAECYLKYLLKRKDYNLDIFIALIEYKNKFQYSILWEVLYKISLKLELDVTETVFDSIVIFLASLNYELPYKFRYLLPFIFGSCTKFISTHESVFIKLSELLIKLSDTEKNDFEMRLVACLCLNAFARHFGMATIRMKVNIIKSLLNLLQDEDDYLRHKVTHFCQIVCNSKQSSPYVCLLSILDVKALLQYIDMEGVKLFVNEVYDWLSSINCKVDSLNPFANENKNIYIEYEWLSLHIKKMKEQILYIY